MYMKRNVKAFVMDVDGTLTDGKIYMGAEGEVLKAFNIKDGYGIHEILPIYGIMTIILTGRTSKIVLNRAKELDVDLVLQNIKDKKEAIIGISQKYNIKLEEIVYVGDDLIDLEAMKICGLKGCPADAVKEIIQISDFVSSKIGGEGAVREFIEWLIEN